MLVSVGSCIFYIFTVKYFGNLCLSTRSWAVYTHSGKAFHTCAHVGITVTTDNVLQGLGSVWLAFCLTALLTKFWLINNLSILLAIWNIFLNDNFCWCKFLYWCKKALVLGNILIPFLKCVYLKVVINLILVNNAK